MAGGSGGDLDSITGLSGGSDGTQIGNVADRMKVDFSASPSGNEAIIPADEINYFFDYLLNAGSNVMRVDGSVTPVVFSSGPGASENWYVTQIIMILQDGGNLDATDYGAIAGGLTNGVLFEQTRNGTPHQMANIKLNLELAMLFSEATLEGRAQGFLNDANIFIGVFSVEPEISLLGATSDVIRVTIRDDLTPLTLQKVAYRAWKVL